MVEKSGKGSHSENPKVGRGAQRMDQKLEAAWEQA